MNEKEIAELRRRLKPEKNNITHVCGCYVNEKQEIVSQFDQPLSLMPEEEAEKLLTTLKRALSGALGKNLLDITFTTQQVVDSDEHRLLMALRSSSLKDPESMQAFFQRVIQSNVLEGNYLILLAYDTYDVPYRSSDGERQDDASSEVFSYILCAICPVKETKPALSYYLSENTLRNCRIDWLVAAPELGFLFPAFDDRSANLYNALYYPRDAGENHQDFVSAVFQSELPMPAQAQKETFQTILEEALEAECRLEVVQAVHGKFSDLIEEHKANKEPEPLVVSRQEVKTILQSCGISEEHTQAFEGQCAAEFGEDAEFCPGNLMDVKQFELRTPDVTIRVNPQRSDLIETRVIDGKKYILIRADEEVEVNGVPIQIS